MKRFNKKSIRAISRFTAVLLFCLVLAPLFANENLIEAIKLYNNKDYEKALLLFKKADLDLLTHREKNDLHYYSFKIYISQSDYINAIEQLKLLLTHNSDSQESDEYKNALSNIKKIKSLIINKALVLKDNKNSDEAIVYAKFYIQEFDDVVGIAKAKAIIGEIYFAARDYENALLYLTNTTFNDKLAYYYKLLPELFQTRMVALMMKVARAYYTDENFLQASKFFEFILENAKDQQIKSEAKSLLESSRQKIKDDDKKLSDTPTIT